MNAREDTETSMTYYLAALGHLDKNNTTMDFEESKIVHPSFTDGNLNYSIQVFIYGFIALLAFFLLFSLGSSIYYYFKETENNAETTENNENTNSSSNSLVPSGTISMPDLRRFATHSGKQTTSGNEVTATRTTETRVGFSMPSTSYSCLHNSVSSSTDLDTLWSSISFDDGEESSTEENIPRRTLSESFLLKKSKDVCLKASERKYQNKHPVMTFSKKQAPKVTTLMESDALTVPPPKVMNQVFPLVDTFTKKNENVELLTLRTTYSEFKIPEKYSCSKLMESNSSFTPESANYKSLSSEAIDSKMPLDSVEQKTRSYSEVIDHRTFSCSEFLNSIELSKSLRPKTSSAKTLCMKVQIPHESVSPRITLSDEYVKSKTLHDPESLNIEFISSPESLNPQSSSSESGNLKSLSYRESLIVKMPYLTDSVNTKIPFHTECASPETPCLLDPHSLKTRCLSQSMSPKTPGLAQPARPKVDYLDPKSSRISSGSTDSFDPRPSAFKDSLDPKSSASTDSLDPRSSVSSEFNEPTMLMPSDSVCMQIPYSSEMKTSDCLIPMLSLHRINRKSSLSCERETSQSPTLHNAFQKTRSVDEIWWSPTSPTVDRESSIVGMLSPRSEASKSMVLATRSCVESFTPRKHTSPESLNWKSPIPHRNYLSTEELKLNTPFTYASAWTSPLEHEMKISKTFQNNTNRWLTPEPPQLF